jgi:urease accessory protein
MRHGLTAAAALTLIPTVALAHPAIGDAHGFVQGFGHPLGGLDHVLAMVTVGLLAWQLGGRALWLVPASFLLAMAAAGALGMAGAPVPFVEVGIAVSVIVLGAMLALGTKAPLAITMALAALFAVFHGHAHGSEMPLDTDGAAYGAGFLLASALLLVTGAAIGAIMGSIGETRARTIYRLSGSLVAFVGLVVLVQAI